MIADIATDKADRKGTPVVRGRAEFIAILAAYLVLATAYGLATPILEAGDENWHEAAVWQIKIGRAHV